LEKAFADLVDESTTYESFDCPKFRNEMQEFSFKSSLITCHGWHKCGSTLCISPEVEYPLSGDLAVAESDSNSATQNDTIPTNRRQSGTLNLFTLQLRKTEKIIDRRWGNDVHVPVATGTLDNIQKYADAVFSNDADQKKAFECLAAKFSVRIHDDALRDETNCGDSRASKRQIVNLERKNLEKVNQGSQLICFLSGFGGSGKSRVIVGLVRYASSLCANLSIRFDRRTIVVPALTGAAAVSINGETSHSANVWKRVVKDTDIEDWKHTYMFILDEQVSCACRKDLEKCYQKCCELKENTLDFGGIDIIFAGDFSQLEPVCAYPLYLEEIFSIWDDMIHTFFELKTSHRFNKDPAWGKLLSRYRDVGPKIADVKKINERLIGSKQVHVNVIFHKTLFMRQRQILIERQ
jgi:hypothetical protein